MKSKKNKNGQADSLYAKKMKVIVQAIRTTSAKGEIQHNQPANEAKPRKTSSFQADCNRQEKKDLRRGIQVAAQVLHVPRSAEDECSESSTGVDLFSQWLKYFHAWWTDTG